MREHRISQSFGILRRSADEMGMFEDARRIRVRRVARDRPALTHHSPSRLVISPRERRGAGRRLRHKIHVRVQNLAQLNEIYDKSWETFFGNSGPKLFFQIDDDFSQSYLSRQLGELETLRETRSGSSSQGSSVTDSSGFASSDNTGYGVTRSAWLGLRKSRQASWGSSAAQSSSSSYGSSNSTTEGWSEGVHKRPLLSPDEIGRLLARVDDRQRPGYPGLVLALVPGKYPVLARRVNYFESAHFRGYFDPHPNHPPPPTLAQLVAEASRRVAAQADLLPPPPPLQFKKPIKKSDLRIWKSVGVAAAIGILLIGRTVFHAN
jgi:TraM recognition site of TraD and TraG